MIIQSKIGLLNTPETGVSREWNEVLNFTISHLLLINKKTADLKNQPQKNNFNQKTI